MADKGLGDLAESEYAKLAAIIGGAGAKGAIVSQVQKWAPQLTTDTAGAVIGGVMYLFGDRVHPLVKYAGAGVLAASFSPQVEKALAQWTQPQQGGTTTTSGEAANVDEYAKQKYGV